MDIRIEKGLETINNLLINNEKVIKHSVQLRLGAMWYRRVIVVATTMRLIVLKRRILGGYLMVDIRWQDLNSIQINESIFEKYLGAALFIETPNGSKVVYGLEVKSAREIYVFSQRQEQEWREKNRIRVIEEERARSGGMMLGSHSFTSGSHINDQGTKKSAKERLSEAHEMYKSEMISDGEYEAIKARIVNEL